MTPLRMILITVTTILFASCTSVSAADANSLQSAISAFDQDGHGDLHSVIVIRHGDVIAERYFNGADPEALVDIRSAGKSITSLLLGVAVDQGAIRSLGDPVEDYWPEAAGTPVGRVRLHDLLTMRAGLAADDDVDGLPGNEDLMDEAEDPLSFALSIPSDEPPGVHYRYNSLAAYVAGIVVSRATGQGLEAFARDNLFQPLGIAQWHWQEDRSGQTKGQGNLFLTARDFARIGEMVLDRGVYGGRQVVSAHWVDESLKPRVDISASDPFASGYGYYWYSQTHEVDDRPAEVFFASGNGGNKIYVIPDRAMVVSIMSRAYGQRHGQRRSEDILRAVLASSPPAG